MWRNQPVSVVLPTYNERDSIRHTIEEFWETGYVDEVIVVNNNAVAGTSEEVRRTKAIEVFEPRQGYGVAIQRGLKECQGYYVVISEPDGTFLATDTLKLLAYTPEFDFVVGSRSTRELIWTGANMGTFLRLGNYAAAKLFEVLFNTITLTDVGCTMRLITRPSLKKIEPYFRATGNTFGLEMLLLAQTHGVPFIQIPVNYKRRVGRSAVTGVPHKTFTLGLQMIAAILSCRIRSLKARG